MRSDSIDNAFAPPRRLGRADRLPAMNPRPVDPRCCPLCGQSNQCANEVERATGQSQPPCWCTGVDFARELLASVPPQAVARACICPACAAAGAG